MVRCTENDSSVHPSAPHRFMDTSGVRRGPAAISDRRGTQGMIQSTRSSRTSWHMPPSPSESFGATTDRLWLSNSNHRPSRSAIHEMCRAGALEQAKCNLKSALIREAAGIRHPTCYQRNRPTISSYLVYCNAYSEKKKKNSTKTTESHQNLETTVY
jgi:hypothetical protein